LTLLEEIHVSPGKVGPISVPGQISHNPGYLHDFARAQLLSDLLLTLLKIVGQPARFAA
jgi:hypothetical protein